MRPPGTDARFERAKKSQKIKREEFIMAWTSTFTVSAGETSTGLLVGAQTLPDAVTSDLYVYGSALQTVADNGAIIRVLAGGETTSTMLGGTSKSQEIIEHTGVANDTVIDVANGYQWQRGSTYRTIIRNGSQCLVGANAISYDTVVSGGSQDLRSAGAKAYRTVVSAATGLKISSGTYAEGTIIRNGHAMVYTGGSAVDTVISGGQLCVAAGAYASNVTIIAGRDARLVLSNSTEVVATGNIVFDMSKTAIVTDTTSYLLNNWQRLSSDAVCSIVVAETDQLSGDYCFAGGVGSLTPTLTVRTDTGIELGSITNKGSILHTEYGSYRLHMNNFMYLDIVADPVAVFEGTTVVSRGTTVDAVTVNASREAYVRKGGTLNNLTVTAAAQGKVVVYDSGTLNNATIDGAAATGNIVISNGGVANSTTLVNGGAAAALLRLSGGVGNDTVASAGQVLVYEGGVANRTVLRGGVQKILRAGAKAYDTVISGGSMEVAAGGSASNVTIMAGARLVLSNSTEVVATGNIVFDMSETAVVTDTSSYLLNNWQRLSSDATFTFVVAEDDQLSGDYCVAGGVGSLRPTASVRTDTGIELGSITNNGSMLHTEYGSYRLYMNNFMYLSITGGSPAELWSGNTRTQSGTVLENITVNAGMSAFAYNGGTISSATVTGAGRLFVYSGGSAIDTTVDQGELILSSGAVAQNNIISGSATFLRVYSGGVASDTQLLTSGARELIYSGGTSLKTIVAESSAFQNVGSYTAGVDNTGALAVSAQLTGIYAEQNVYSGAVAQYTSVLASNAVQNVYADAVATGTLLNAQSAMLKVSSGGLALDAIVREGRLAVRGGTISRAVIASASGKVARIDVSSGGVASSTIIESGIFMVSSGGKTYDAAIHSGYVSVSNGAVASRTRVVGESGYIEVLSAGSAVDTVVFANSQRVSSGGSATHTIVGGSGFDLVAGYEASAVVVAGQQQALSGGRIVGTVVKNGYQKVNGGGIASDTIVSGIGAWQVVYSDGQANNVYIDSGACQMLSSGASATSVTIASGGSVYMRAGTTVLESPVFSGGWLVVSSGCRVNLNSSATNGKITIDFLSGSNNTSGIINDISKLGSNFQLHVTGMTSGRQYKIADVGNTSLTVYCDWGGVIFGRIYETALRAGQSYTNAAQGITYSMNNAGTVITTASFSLTAKTTAATLTTADTLVNSADRAARWNANTTYSGSVTLANNSIAGDAWLVIDGTNVSGALYGASGTFNHDVNIAINSGTIRNLAAGATAGDSVAGVHLTVEDGNFTGTAYAGGFGNVNGDVRTYIHGGTYAKDFYAGALANKLGTTTSITGEIYTMIAIGEFSGNIYGASAVKTDKTKGNNLRHSVGDVTLWFGGQGKNVAGENFCIFAGGYATGDATGTVYTVGDITLHMGGGDWGDTSGNGRGVFGGIMASGVRTQAQNITIDIDHGIMGNVYGGGWAQKGGASIAGDVNITVAFDAQVRNIFGGGSHSTSGGTTQVSNVNITIAGGNVIGNIFARGHLDGDAVTGDAAVTFIGGNDYSCNVYGYNYIASADGDSTLNFSNYTGTLSGNIGGFDSVAFTDGTAMTLGTAAADVNNGKWEFDLAGRDDALADTSLLTWSGADFAGDTVRVNFADATQAAAGWSIATAAFDATTTFDFYIGSSETPAATVAYNTAIDGGAFNGWGFTSVDGTLKFAQITA